KGKAKPATPVGLNGKSAVTVAPKVKVVEEPVPAAASTRPVLSLEQERKRYPNYSNSLGGQMFLIPSGEFIMGNPFPDAPPNETPHFRVTITRFYISRFPITNAHYEAFDPLHKSKRAAGTGD